MRRTRVFNSEGFRFAALFAAVFIALAGALCAAVLWIVADTQRAAIMRANDADIDMIENGFRAEGVEEAAEVIKQRLGSRESSAAVDSGVYMVLQTAAAAKIAGNLPAGIPRLGGFDLRGGRIAGRGADIAPGVYVFVGRDTAPIASTRARLLQAFGWILAVSIVLAGAGALFLRAQLLRRVDAITRTCEGIIAGRLDARIPVQRRGDELERLSIAINEMLNRMSMLLENLKQVSSDVAHDLRTPLTRLRNRLEKARLGAVTTDEYAAAVSQAIDDTDQVLVIFSALLRIAQIEAGTRVAAFAPVSLSRLLENVVEMYQPVAEDHRQILMASVEPDVHIRGDAELLTQMFSNLVENAIRHSPASTHIRVELRAADGAAVVASVIDDGPGIPAPEHDKVLRRFYRVSDSRAAAGHGLGLALVAAIASLHQATLSLQDAEPGLRVCARFC